MNDEVRFRLYWNMYRIRAVEEAIADRYPRGEMRCPVHLSIGQEAISAIFAEVVRNEDFCVSTHRGHAHYLAKGGDLTAMISEIYGKATGCSKGKGGSMHLIDLDVNFMGTSAIVGNSIPVGVGLALAAQLKNSDQISCVFLGDGAVEEGVFYESVNFAVVRHLPVIFICENNLYSVYSPLEVRQPQNRHIFEMVRAMGITASASDSANLEECYQVMRDAFEAVRAGHGPQFLEFSTYRWREHCGYAFDNDLGYRTEEEFLYWQARDPLSTLETKLGSEDHGVRNNDIAQMKDRIGMEIKAAFAAAESAPFPSPGEAFTDVYAPLGKN